MNKSTTRKGTVFHSYTLVRIIYEAVLYFGLHPGMWMAVQILVTIATVSKRCDYRRTEMREKNDKEGHASCRLTHGLKECKFIHVRFY